jgi:hypothetical protein
MVQESQTRVQLRIKAATPVITGLALVALLLHDWGEGNVFSGIRPAVKSTLNQLYGAQPPAAKTPERLDSTGTAE